MNFSELNLPESIVKAVTELGYSEPTNIQKQAIPLVLQGKDLLGHSQTGSGKTAAFGLPIISQVHPGQGIQALILTPTRELCVQVCDSLKGFSKYIRLNIVPVFGGVGLGPQINAVKTANIIVATPGRLLDLMQRGLRFTTLKFVVLDEADRMLDMGFIDDVEKILKATPRQRQTLLFSATLSGRLRSIVNRHMNSPVSVESQIFVDRSLLTERAYAVSMQEKFSLLVHLLKSESQGIAIVFCATRHYCDKVARKLRAQKIDATPIHGGLSQSKRIHAINMLHKRGIGILVATDVASRGLHIDNISHVYNFDLPKTSDDYTHRIGRTARAGAKGEAVTFVGPHEGRDFKMIMRDINRQINVVPLPTFEKIPEVAEPYGGERRFGGGGGHRGGRPPFKRRGHGNRPKRPWNGRQHGA